MRSMSENRLKWNEPYKFNDTGFVYGTEYLPELRSCFYDFGAELPVNFSGYSEEGGSDFARELMSEFGLSKGN